MGRDKATLPFLGEPLLARVVRILASAPGIGADAPDVGGVVVVPRPGQELPPLPDGTRVARDEVEGRGPLAGIAAGLRASRADLVFVTTCDVPLLDPRFVDLLFASAGDASLVFPEEGGVANALCAVWRRSALEAVDARLAAGRLRPFAVSEELPTITVPEDRLRAADPELRSLRDCDTPEAYEAALRDAAPLVCVEFYDVARLRAGRARVDVAAATLGEAVARAADVAPGLVGEVVVAGALSPHFRANLNGARFVADAELRLSPGDSVLLLSAQSGG
ncbi:MAG: Molybdenum cofactor guanylyltransferase [Planctomycetes bacterium]|nr:Molybdenum cofactor guanylyltransferase [Planctomycetota bacterium]